MCSSHIIPIKKSLLGEIGRHNGLKIRPLGIVGSSPIVGNLGLCFFICYILILL